MAIVFEANYSKKLGLPGFSSHQYSVTVRCEVADIKQVPAESNRLYRLMQESVDQEIQNVGFLPTNGNGSTGNGHEHKDNGNGDGQWSCSDKQKGLILKIVRENNLDKQGVDDLAQERFGIGVKELNRLQASGLIEEMLEKHGGKESGNGRSNRRYPARRFQQGGVK